MAKKRKKYDDDDGRVIAKMNVEGMPWYTPGPTSSLSDDEREDEQNIRKHENSPDDLTKKEMLYIYLGAMKAGCVFSLIMIGVLSVAGIIAFLALGGWTQIFK